MNKATKENDKLKIHVHKYEKQTLLSLMVTRKPQQPTRVLISPLFYFPLPFPILNHPFPSFFTTKRLTHWT